MLEKCRWTPTARWTGARCRRRKIIAPKHETAFAPPRAGFEQTWPLSGRSFVRQESGVNDNSLTRRHSLQVVQVQTHLRERVGADLPVLKLFELSHHPVAAAFLARTKRKEPFVQKILERTQRQRSRRRVRSVRRAGEVIETFRNPRTRVWLGHGMAGRFFRAPKTYEEFLAATCATGMESRFPFSKTE
jgi:hypothetical protein